MVDVTEEFDRDCAWGGRIRTMANRIEELEREVADLTRHNQELREAIIALMEPDTPRILHNRQGVIVLDQPLPPR